MGPREGGATTLLPPSTGPLLVAHVDDIIMISPPEVVDELCKQIETKMAVKWKKPMDASEWTRYLGREWQRRGDSDRVAVRAPPRYFASRCWISMDWGTANQS